MNFRARFVSPFQGSIANCDLFAQGDALGWFFLPLRGVLAPGREAGADHPVTAR